MIPTNCGGMFVPDPSRRATVDSFLMADADDEVVTIRGGDMVL